MIYLLTRIFASCLICLGVTSVLVGCGNALGGNNSEDAAQAACLGKEFKLRAGQQIALQGESLRIRFAAVQNDSRCPSDVTCVWAGNAEVLLEVSTSGGEKKTLRLNTNKNPKSAVEDRHQGYNIKLVKLSPYPRSDQRIAVADYVVTLLVSEE